MLDREVLSKSLWDLYEHLGGRGAWAEISKRTGAHNISRLAKGEIEKPEVATWLKLHAAYPDFIPPPVYTDGTIMKQGHRGLPSCGGLSTILNGNGSRQGEGACDLRQDVLDAAELMQEVLSPLEIEAYRQKLAKKKEALLKG